MSKPQLKKVNFSQHTAEIFAIEKAGMASTPYLYQHASLEAFVHCFENKYPNNQAYICYDENSKPVGFYIHEPSSDHKTDELILIVVHPKHQGHGYGKTMLNHYLSSLPPNTTSQVATHEKNLPAIHRYQSCGYKLIKKLPDLYDDGEVRVLLERIPEEK